MRYFFYALAIACGLPFASSAQDKRICKNQPVPNGYRIVGEILSPECGRTGWIIRRVGAKEPPIIASESPQAELGEGLATSAERRTIRRLRAEAALNVPFRVNAAVRIGTYYYGGYAQVEATHHAFELRDGTGSAFFYAPKNETEGLRRAIAARRGRVRGVFTVVLPSEIPDGGETVGDLIGYRLDPQPKDEGGGMRDEE